MRTGARYAAPGSIFWCAMSRARAFLEQVLGLAAVYGDADFAVLRHDGHDLILHADHTYSEHPLLALTGDGGLRGAGVELRLYGIDPDAAEARARARGDYRAGGDVRQAARPARMLPGGSGRLRLGPGRGDSRVMPAGAYQP